MFFWHFFRCLRLREQLSHFRTAKVARLHSCTDEDVRNHILITVVQQRGGPCQILCGTSTIEVGLDFKDVVRCIHHGVPSTVESYVQGLGRAARVQGSHAWACLYYNLTDFSPKKGRSFSEQMRQYCLNTTICRAELLASFFGQE